MRSFVEDQGSGEARQEFEAGAPLRAAWRQEAFEIKRPAGETRQRQRGHGGGRTWGDCQGQIGRG
jgi:hypothetical protein